MAYKTRNPALNQGTFENLPMVASTEVMTLEGTASKSMILLALAFCSGMLGWHVETVSPFGTNYILITILVAFIVAVITIRKKTLSPSLAPLYALLEGFALGGVSSIFEAQYQGIVLQSVLLTCAIFFAMLLVYRLRLIRATENFKLGVAAATGGICIFYLIDLVIGFFGKSVPLINSSSNAGIIFSVFVIVVAAFNLVVDFDFVESGVEKGAPKYMEWYSSFGLFVTVVWLYLEILRLLSKGRRR